jgi:hypothetical protein
MCIPQTTCTTIHIPLAKCYEFTLWLAFLLLTGLSKPSTQSLLIAGMLAIFPRICDPIFRSPLPEPAPAPLFGAAAFSVDSPFGAATFFPALTDGLLVDTVTEIIGLSTLSPIEFPGPSAALLLPLRLLILGVASLLMGTGVVLLDFTGALDCSGSKNGSSRSCFAVALPSGLITQHLGSA